MQIESPVNDRHPNPPCPSHPSSDVLFYCQICSQFLCVVCFAEHSYKSGHTYIGKSYDEFLTEREQFLQKIKQDSEDKRKLYAMVQELAEKTSEDYEGTLMKKIALIEKSCQQYRENLEGIQEEARQRLEEHKLKNQEERGKVFEKALEQVRNGNYQNLKTVQQFYLLPLEEDKAIVGWVKEIKMTNTLSNFVQTLKKMYRLFRWYQRSYQDNVAKFDRSEAQQQQQQQQEANNNQQEEEEEEKNYLKKDQVSMQNHKKQREQNQDNNDKSDDSVFISTEERDKEQKGKNKHSKREIQRQSSSEEQSKSSIERISRKSSISNSEEDSKIKKKQIN